MRDFAWRLSKAADEVRPRLSQAMIAGKLGVSPSRVGNWFQGRHLPLKREREALAAMVGRSVEWLMTGTDSVSDDAQVAYEVGSAATQVREIPVVSWSHAGEAATYEELPKHWHGKVATTSTDKRAFAVTVEGDCMEPRVFAGDRVVLEPLHEPRNGRAVVAKFVDDAVQLRIYTKLPDGMIRLASMKPEIYPTLDYKPASFSWIYPVRELVRSM